MTILELLLWLSIFTLFYSYIGYGILVGLFVKARDSFKKKKVTENNYEDLPHVTLVVAAYNEEKFIKEKILNTLSLDYPIDKCAYIFITDGSTDKTEAIARTFPQLTVLHNSTRAGKVAAINRAMEYVTTPIVVFSDANTILNKKSLLTIAEHYYDPKVGGVAGEKRIILDKKAQAESAGEGIYWKYESFLKKMDSELYSVVGAAGELFSIRTALYEKVDNTVILDDFIISLRICLKGYRIVYEPNSYAMETASATLEDEEKRKIRISAGGFQAIARLPQLFNIFKYPILSFQYISHRVLRWAICPFLLPVIIVINVYLVWQETHPVYNLLLGCQILFYIIAFAGWILARKKIKLKILFIPYYFLFINISIYKGFIRYVKGQQSAIWEKSVRKETVF